MNGSNMKRTIEALLIATDVPLTHKKIIEITELQMEEIVRCVEELNQEYRESNRAFEIKEIAGGYQIYTLSEFALWVGALHDRKSKLSKVALETLAIVAYHQPITRAEIEKVRGVDSTYMLDVLLQKNLIKTCGRLPIPGRPIRYGTTREFLRYFGIKDLDDLPREEDFGEAITSVFEDTSAEPSEEAKEDKPPSDDQEQDLPEEEGFEDEITEDDVTERFTV
jgi:segregation and condensation protein B